MNRKNILEIARALIDKVAKFNMSTVGFDTDCGSAGCIAGHIAYLHPRKSVGIYRDNGDGSVNPAVIGQHFKISIDEACRIFYGGTRSVEYITRWDAAAALVRFATDRTIDFKQTAKPCAIAMVEAAEREISA